jgi:hypothetical protein
LAVALILDGRSRSEAAKVAGVTLQIVRDWVLRFNESGPDGLVTRAGEGLDLPCVQTSSEVRSLGIDSSRQGS